MSWMIVVLSLVAGLAPSPTATGAEEEAMLAALTAAALEASPEVAEARARVAAARERATDARALPDPMLEVTYVNDGRAPSLGTREMTTLGVMLSQELTRPSVRRTRGAIAADDAAREELRLRRAELGVRARARRAFFELRRAQEARVLTEGLGPLWTHIAEAARARYEVGRGAQADLVRAQLERTRLAVGRADAEAAVAAAEAELDGLLGRAWEGTLPEAPLALRPLDRSLEGLLAEAERESPELRAAAIAEERDARAVSLARASGGFDFTAQAGYMNRGGLDPMWQVGLGVGLPLWRSAFRARVAASAAGLEGTQAERERLRRALRQRTQARAVAIRAAQQKADLYREAILPQAQLAVDSALAAYEAGTAPLTQALEAVASLYRDRLAHLAEIAEHERQVASLFEWSAGPSEGDEDRGRATSGGMR